MKILITLLLLLPFTYNLKACSVYKITMNGKTMVGNNEDYWNPNTKMWFEKGENGYYGNMYVGFDNFYPQGGMNEKGLVFDGFSINPQQLKSRPDKLSPENNMLKYIMQRCKNTEEVYTLLEKYDLTTLLSSGLLMFVDADGNYLLVEGDVLTKGKDKKYLQSNFCPSQTPETDKVDISFYQSGRKLMDAKVDTALSYLTALSDTLHQSFPQDLGGTQYTTIYDLNEKVIHLYYYHDYSKGITISLPQELKKGNRSISIPDLFPENLSGKENSRKINTAKAFIKELANPEFSSNYSKIKNEIKTKNLSVLLSLFESDMNTVGYDLLKEKDKAAAINVFKLNVVCFPNSWNAYDSLGDGYFEDNKKDLAVTNYKKSLELNPENQNAINQLKKLAN
jgi:tetratricopeptide (TPR) repeat protein